MDDNDFNLDELYNFDEALNEAFSDEGEFNEVSGSNDIVAPNVSLFVLLTLS